MKKKDWYFIGDTRKLGTEREVRDSGAEVAQLFSKIGGNTLIIRNTHVGKTGNSEPLSHLEKTEFQFPGQSTQMRVQIATKSAPAITNSKWNSSARLTFGEVKALLHFYNLLRDQSSFLH